MIILIVAGLAGLLAWAALWVSRGSQFTCLDADSEIPDTVPADWVDSHWSDKG